MRRRPIGPTLSTNTRECRTKGEEEGHVENPTVLRGLGCCQIKGLLA
jgi:hypothetical protein